MNRRRPHHGSWMDVVRSYSWHRRSLDRERAEEDHSQRDGTNCVHFQA